MNYYSTLILIRKMMVTKLTILIILTSLFLLKGQEMPESQLKIQEFAKKFHQISTPKLSENGQWIGFKKTSITKNDTIFIYDTKKTSEPLIAKVDMYSFDFLQPNYLVFQNELNMELIDLKTNKTINFTEVQNYKFLPTEGLLLLHYTSSKNQLIELRNLKGIVLNKMEHVEQFDLSIDETIYLVKNDCEGRTQKLFRFSIKENKQLFETNKKIQSFQIDPDENGLIVHAKRDNEEFTIDYFDLKNNKTYPFYIPFKIDYSISKTLTPGEDFLINALVKKEKRPNYRPSIWYSNDYNLTEKFNEYYSLNYLWKPKVNYLQLLNPDKLSQSVVFNHINKYIIVNSFNLENYKKKLTPLEVTIKSNKSATYEIDSLTQPMYVSPTGRYLLSKEKESWYLKDIEQNTSITLNENLLLRPYFTIDSKFIVFEGPGGIWKYNILQKRFSQIHSFPNWDVEILNSKTEPLLNGYLIFKNQIDLKNPLLVKIKKELHTAYLVLDKDKKRWIVNQTNDYIGKFTFSDDLKKFCYTQQNYNSSPRISFKIQGDKTGSIEVYNALKESDEKIKQKFLSYPNKYGKPLKGILYYPIDFNENKDYPMVVHIYYLQNHLKNKYLGFLPLNQAGFNPRLYIENGYFVFLPDINVDGPDGVGIKALNDVNSGLDAVNKLQINISNIGLIGHSLGGYETNFIATQSNRFKAYVAGSGMSDIIHSYHNFSYNFHNPEYQRIEVGAYNMRLPFISNKEYYIKNNPIFYADKVSAPILLWTGKNDENVPTEQSMAMHLALKRLNKSSVFLLYENEAHALLNQNEQMDLFSRIFEWFETFLKEKKIHHWILKGIKKDVP